MTEPAASQPPQTPEPRPEQTFDALHLNALSDGLFAIVLTLLVLDIRLPETINTGTSARALLEQLVPALAGYLLTFVLAGLY